MFKRILLVIVFAFAMSSMLSAAEAVNFGPIVNFDGIIEDISETFTDVLKEFWVFFLSLFFIWIALATVKKILDEKHKHDEAEDEREQMNEKNQETYQAAHRREGEERNSTAYHREAVLEDNDPQKKDQGY